MRNKLEVRHKANNSDEFNTSTIALKPIEFIAPFLQFCN